MTAAPAITVVVPTHGRPGAAARVVSALDAQQLPDGARFDVIVVDDGSPVPVEIDVDSRAPASVRVLRQAHSGPAAARNAGINAARFNGRAASDHEPVQAVLRPAPAPRSG